MEIFSAGSTNAPLQKPNNDKMLREAAQELEATFLAEMLKAARVGETPKEFGGGAGEEHFASFMRQEQAQKMAEAGGIGLAESLFKALKERSNV
ncbi:MAG: rod-binding protein [Pelagimonas sp.]|jgi:Rod binding domain-containing protein|nr:rod-binding protein [Pelagimonas sp.]